MHEGTRPHHEEYPEQPNHTFAHTDVHEGVLHLPPDNETHNFAPDALPTEKDGPHISVELDDEKNSVSKSPSSDREIVSQPQNKKERIPLVHTSVDWLDERLDFFRVYPYAEAPLVERIVEHPNSVRAEYVRLLEQYAALRPIIDGALAPLHVSLPDVSWYRGMRPETRRQLEAAISAQLDNVASIYKAQVDSLVSRLTVITEAVSAYEEAAEELEISLNDEAGDSELSAAK